MKYACVAKLCRDLTKLAIFCSLSSAMLCLMLSSWKHTMPADQGLQAIAVTPGVLALFQLYGLPRNRTKAARTDIFVVPPALRK